MPGKTRQRQNEDLKFREVFGVGLRTLREKKGLSQAALAKAVGLSRAQVTNIELGRSGVTAQGMQRFAAALGVTITVLLKPVPECVSIAAAEMRKARAKARELSDRLGM